MGELSVRYGENTMTRRTLFASLATAAVGLSSRIRFARALPEPSSGYDWRGVPEHSPIPGIVTTMTVADAEAEHGSMYDWREIHLPEGWESITVGYLKAPGP